MMKKRILNICVSVALLLAVAAGCFYLGALTRPEAKLPQKESEPEILKTFRVEEVPMEHNGTLGFSWVTESMEDAKMLDYLAPQLPKIFETAGLEGPAKEFTVKEGVAKYDSESGMIRCYQFNNGQDGATLLSHSSYIGDGREKLRVNVQVISPARTMGGSNFGFADFDGDGKDELYSMTGIAGADNWRCALGIFSYDEGAWGAPMFWASQTGEEPLFLLPWGISFEPGFTIKNGYEVHHKATGYAGKIPADDVYLPQGYEIDSANIHDVTIVDVDADGIFEMIVEQEPFKWPGFFISLLHYNKKTKAFETLHAEFSAYAESFDTNAEPAVKCQDFLSRAGYNASNAIFQPSL